MKDKQISNKNRRTGGRNEIVEIDESKIAKRKYNKGHKVEGVWVIGGIQRSRLKNKIKNENKKLFLLPIEERNIENTVPHKTLQMFCFFSFFACHEALSTTISSMLYLI